MKKYFALFLFVLTATLSFAQSNYQDVVYLKDGQTIRGVIIEQVPNKSIKIETADRNIFVFQMDEIEKLTKELVQGKSGSSLNRTELQTGYRGIVEWGYQIGMGDYGVDRLKLNIINGYQINPYLSLGFGTGLRYYYNSEEAIIPVFADFRANFRDYKVSPYLSFGVGYSFDATRDFKGVGYLFNPAVGVSFKVSDKVAMYVGCGYEMQNKKSYNWYYDVFETDNNGALSIIFGISF